MTRPAITSQRLFDLAIAIPGLIAVSPILAVASALIWITDGKPVIFRHERIGMDMEPFEILKFRTMTNRTGPDLNLSAVNDTRITPIGSFLRRTKIDELPQLVNVINGTMSLVGPRPEVREYVECERSRFERLLTRRPGIADPAVITFRDEDSILAEAPDNLRETLYLEQVLPEKLRLSLEYHDRRTLLSDVSVLFRTVLTTLKVEKEQ